MINYRLTPRHEWTSSQLILNVSFCERKKWKRKSKGSGPERKSWKRILDAPAWYTVDKPTCWFEKQKRMDPSSQRRYKEKSSSEHSGAGIGWRRKNRDKRGLISIAISERGERYFNGTVSRYKENVRTYEGVYGVRWTKTDHRCFPVFLSRATSTALSSSNEKPIPRW